MTPRWQRHQQQRLHGPGRGRPRALGALGAGLAAAGLAAATAGCSTAPPGAAGTSPAIGPVRTGAAAANFPPFPVPATWNGKDYRNYEMVYKPKTGSKPRSVFRVIAQSDLVFWLTCIGAGTARLTSPAIGFHWSVPCGTSADPAAVNFSPRASIVGHGVKVQVTAPPGARWEVRVDVAAPPGLAPAPARTPS